MANAKKAPSGYMPGFSGGNLTSAQKASQQKLFQQSSASTNLAQATAEYKVAKELASKTRSAYEASLTNKDIKLIKASSYVISSGTVSITHGYANDINSGSTGLLLVGFTPSLNGAISSLGYSVNDTSTLSFLKLNEANKVSTDTQGSIIYGTHFLSAVNGGNMIYIANCLADFQNANKKLNVAKAKLAKATAAAKLAGVTLTATSTPDGPAPVIPTGSDNSDVTYNIPSVTDAYFSSSSSVLDGKSISYGTEFFVDAGNRPIKVREAQDLWNADGAHKGMFQTFLVPKTAATKNIGANVTSSTSATKANTNKANVGRYGFQFLYNPGTISMEYNGAPNIDPGLQMSNQQMIPLIGAANTSSGMSFSLVLNRMPDMRYLSDSHTLTAGEFQQVYGQSAPNNYEESLKRIKNTGTMYDVEFFLQTLLGFEAWSTLRGSYTPDIGYIASFPVELHLGKSLRYIVLVTDIRVTHTIFTKDMVPVYTNVDISVGRLPDTGFNTLLHSYKAPSTSRISSGSRASSAQ